MLAPLNFMSLAFTVLLTMLQKRDLNNRLANTLLYGYTIIQLTVPGFR